MAKKNNYVVVGEREYLVKVSVVRYEETGKEYVNYVMSLDNYNIQLSLRNYDSNVNSLVKEKVLNK